VVPPAEPAPVPQKPLQLLTANTTNMQLSHKLPSYTTQLANLLASYKLQECKVGTCVHRPALLIRVESHLVLLNYPAMHWRNPRASTPNTRFDAMQPRLVEPCT
jgi:hypothetical protein